MLQSVPEKEWLEWRRESLKKENKHFSVIFFRDRRASGGYVKMTIDNHGNLIFMWGFG